MKFPRHLSASIAFCFTLVTFAHGQLVTEDFSSYSVANSLSTPLNGGTGWAGAWSTASQGTTTNTGVVANASPLASGGNYLDATMDRQTGGHVTSLYRQVGADSLAVRQGIHTISFNWRPDSLSAFDNSNDRFEFFNGFDTTAAGLFSANYNATLGNESRYSSYLVGVFGTSRGASSSAAAFTGYDPDVAAVGEAFNAENYFNIGSGGTSNSGNSLIALAGTTYTLSITVDPLAKTYDVSVTDGTTTAFTNGFKFWGNPTQTQEYLVFGTRGNSNGEDRDFSIDNFQLVPEPTGLVLMLGATVTLLLSRRRVARH